MRYASLVPLMLVLAVACQDATAPGVVRVWGDVNADGRVRADDVALTTRHAVGLSIAPYDTLPGDVDADSAVTTRDALIISSYVEGLPTAPFRVGQPMP